MAEGSKIFVNDTDKDVNIIMMIRDGDSPEDLGGTEVVSVAHGQQVRYIYEGEPGSDGLVFLNGLLIEWLEGNNWVGVSRRVHTRGDAWDNVLNTNSTVTISAVTAGTLNASGTNA